MAENVGSIYYDLSLDTSKFDAAASNLNNRLDSIGSKMTAVGKKMSLFITAPIVAGGVAAFKSAAHYQQLQIAFETMLGSADKAKKLLGELDKLAMTTPFSITDVQDTAQQLLAYGIAAEDIIPTTKMLGDISAGNADRFKMLALAYGQVQAKTRLAGQEMLQFTNAGVNLRELLSKKLGVSIADIDKLMEQGKISFQDVRGALMQATSEGGKFHNLMQRQSQTTAGQLSNLQDNITRLGRQIGLVLLPAVQSLVNFLMPLVQGFRNLNPAVQKAILFTALFIAALGPLILVIGNVITAIRGISIAMAFVAANPIILAIVAIVALIAGLAFLIIHNWDTLKQWFTSFWGWLSATVVAVWQGIYNFLSSILNAIRSVVTGAFNVIRAIVNAVMGAIRAVIAGTWGAIYGIIASFIGRIIGLFAPAFSWLIGRGRDIIGGLISGITSMAGALWSGIASVSAGIGKFFAGAGSWLFSAGQSIVSGLVHGIESMAGKVADAASHIANSAKDKVTNLLGIHSPSKVFQGYGKNIVQGFVKGIAGSAGMANMAMQGLVASVTPQAANNTTINNGIYGNINIGSRADADYFISQLMKDDQAVANGLTPRRAIYG